MAINLERFISNACCNSCQSFYDYYVEANVKFRSGLGMNEVIIRRQLGHCCDWCAKLAGIYTPYNAPDDIYKRHENCRCLVTYKSDNGYQDIWNKRIYQEQKQARIDKLKRIQEHKDISESYEIQKRILRSQGNVVYDATNEWNANAKPGEAEIGVVNELRINGEKLIIDNKKVILDLEPYEKKTLNEFVNKFGGILKYHPRVISPEGIKTPDCLYNGERFDLKTLGLYHPDVKSKDLLLHTLQNYEEQAHCFIIDSSRLTVLTSEDVIDQAIKLFRRDKTLFVSKLILYDGNEFYKVLERI